MLPPIAAMREAPRTPFLALDLDAFDRNVDCMADTIVRRGGKRWRPHTKAIRSPVLARRLIDAGARGVTCANANDAAAMVAGGIDDVLIASQLVQGTELRLVAELNRRAKVMIAIDSPVHAHRAGVAAAAAGVRVPVLIEVEVGLNRAGVAPGVCGVELARVVDHHPHLRFCGFMAWEGHATRIAEPSAKRAAIEHAVRLLTATAQQCRDAGIASPIVSCGGTGTFEFASGIDDVTELQAGGGVFGDLRYRVEFGVALERSLTLWATVVARPTSRRLVCDAGWKSLAVYPTPPRPLDLPAVVAMAHAAEHLTLTMERDAEAPAIGDRVAFEIGYADATTFLHRQMVGYRGKDFEETFELAGTSTSTSANGESNHGL